MLDIKDTMEVHYTSNREMRNAAIDLHVIVEGTRADGAPENVDVIATIKNAGVEVLDLRKRLAAKEREVEGLIKVRAIYRDGNSQTLDDIKDLKSTFESLMLKIGISPATIATLGSAAVADIESLKRNVGGSS